MKKVRAGHVWAACLLGIATRIDGGDRLKESSDYNRLVRGSPEPHDVLQAAVKSRYNISRLRHAVNVVVLRLVADGYDILKAHCGNVRRPKGWNAFIVDRIEELRL